MIHHIGVGKLNEAMSGDSPGNESRFLEFIQGEKVLLVRSRDHESSTWQKTSEKSLDYRVPMKYEAHFAARTAN